ncbi:MAG: dipeptide ABC transporter ATP-binding protein [Alphaproteobacteria bacterium]|nr:dipeptide ABC transporter ATP-binding protein [Alphaproteobacteria bacterium]
MNAPAPILAARSLTKHYAVSQGALSATRILKAVSGVSFEVSAGASLAVVGESGCGKSTLARLVAMIEPPSAGALTIEGRDATEKAAVKDLRSSVQFIFQDTYGSLNPRKTVGATLEEPLKLNTAMRRAERREAARDMLARVGLRPEHIGRYPHMFSGGQRQRIAIARALMLQPKIVVADEPVSALDISVQAQILNLLLALQDELGQAYLFISHDLSVVRHMAEEIMVMYLGSVVERGSRSAILDRPRHPYTRALIASTPSVDPARRQVRVAVTGEPPSPFDPPSGCAFRGRCPHATEVCAGEIPKLRSFDDRLVACHRAEDIA